MVEGTLRPRTLDEYIGQREVKANLSVLLAAAKGRGEASDHVLLYGPPGLGKTTLATIIARELGVNVRYTSGPAIERAGDLRRDPDLARRARRPVHRRDPPPQPGRRGDPLSGDGGLRARRDDRQGAVGAVAAAQPEAVHRRRRDDPRGSHQLAAARPLRGHLPTRLLHRRGADRDRRAVGDDPGRPDRARGVARHRPSRPRDATHRQSAAQARPRSRRGPWRRARRRGDRARRDARDGDRRRRARLHGPQAAGRDHPEVRVGAGRRRGAGGGPVRGGRDHRGRVRAVPPAARLHRPDAAGPDRDRARARASVGPRLRDPAAAPRGGRHAERSGTIRSTGPAGRTGRTPTPDA